MHPTLQRYAPQVGFMALSPFEIHELSGPKVEGALRVLMRCGGRPAGGGDTAAVAAAAGTATVGTATDVAAAVGSGGGDGMSPEAAEAATMEATAAEAAAAFEVAAAALGLGGARLAAPLSQGRYGYRGQPPVADCAELCARELANALLWSPEAQAFDASRLPQPKPQPKP